MANKRKRTKTKCHLFLASFCFLRTSPTFWEVPTPSVSFQTSDKYVVLVISSRTIDVVRCGSSYHIISNILTSLANCQAGIQQFYDFGQQPSVHEELTGAIFVTTHCTIVISSLDIRKYIRLLQFLCGWAVLVLQFLFEHINTITSCVLLFLLKL